MGAKIGYLLPTRENVMREHHAASTLLDGARRARDLGFDSIWAGDSLLARPRHDPLTLLAAVAAAVPEVQLGTAVLLPALRNPVVLAQQLATIDQISEGRLVVGAGIAADAPGVRAEFAAAGVPFEGRVGRLMEGIRLMRALWQGTPVDWEGRWPVVSGTLAPQPWRHEGPPIWLAGSVPAAIERAARHCDGWFPIGPDPHTLAERHAHFVESAKTAGRDPAALTTAIYLTVSVMPDADAANAAIDVYLEGYYGVPAAAMRQFQACCGGPLESVQTFVRSYLAAGAQHVVLRLVGDHAKTLQALAADRAALGA